MKRKFVFLCAAVFAFATFVMDQSGQSLAPPRTAADKGDPAVLFPFSNENDGFYGYTDARGQVVIKPQFLTAEDFSEGLARVGICTDYGPMEGFIDPSGEVVIRPKFDQAYDFSEGLAAVVINDQLGFIDKTGRTIIEPQFDAETILDDFKFSEGLAAVKVGDKWGYIDRVGQFVVKPQFDEAGPFSEGLAEIDINHKHGYINAAGKMIIKPRFDSALAFSEGLARVNVGYTYGINSTDPEFRAGKWGYVDRFGKMVIEPQFEDWADDFSEGRATVRAGGKYGFIDKSGKVVIDIKYEDAGSFSEGLAPVQLAGKSGYIDLNGNTIIPFQFNDARNFSNGFALVNKFRNRINKNGEIVWTDPNQRRSYSSAKCEAKIEPPPPTAEEITERRRAVHELLLKGEYQHDGAGELMYIGDMTSVPALLSVLKDHAPKSEGAPVICTYGHAIAALQKITGQKLTKYEDWRLWWESYQESHGKVAK